jgi:hypothetical protein
VPRYTSLIPLPAAGELVVLPSRAAFRKLQVMKTEIILTAMVKPSFMRGELLARLIQEKDEDEKEAKYYLSCWSLSYPLSLLPLKQEPFEDFETENWKRDISTAEANEWIKALREQSFAFAPEPRKVLTLDGTTYDLTYEDDDRKIHISWHDPIPQNWKSIEFVVKRIIELADKDATP